MTGVTPAQGARGRPRVAAIVLAAGAGSRFLDEGHKLLAALPARDRSSGATVAGRAIENAMAADIGPVLVVTGAVRIPLPNDVDEVSNPRWSEGQMTSVRAGIDAASELGAERVVIGLADQPGIEPAAWRTIADHDGLVSVATYAGRRGNPVGLDRAVWDLLPAAGDEGARALMRARPDLVREVACTGSPADIDTVEDLRQWQSS